MRSTSGRLAGVITLAGVDELSLDTDRRDAAACVTYDVGGVAGARYCRPELTGTTGQHVDGVAWTCEREASMLQLTGFARGAPLYTEVQLRRAAVQREIALDFVRLDQTTGDDEWRSPAVPLADAGNFSCTALASDVGVRMIAVYADGSIACHVTGDWPEFYGRLCF